ncbi:MAG: DISARM system SNF2-like helicase DrmD [Acidobacteriota bacterium]
MTAAPDVSSLLHALTRDRLVEIGRGLGVSLPAREKKDRQIERLVGAGRLEVAELVGLLHRDELKAACRRLELDDSGRARPVLARRLLEAAGVVEDVPAPIFRLRSDPRDVPKVGDVVRVRHRQYLVEAVVAPRETDGDGRRVSAHRVSLVCLDDDAQGRPLDVLWELELGARVLQLETEGLGRPTSLDPPGRFGAYLATLRWNAVTATDARLFQSPFRAGIRLLNHQLVPLERALSLPRANLFVADDVGLGKTIEAGLVLQELRLRQRVDFVLVVCPAAICLQWRDELWKRFGLRFEVMHRDFVARRRQERGFGVNPWTTHQRFIVSHSILRRPEYRDPLLHHLGERARKSLLILDEAHVAAPASARRYAVDSEITRVVRDVAPRFENRLFLSATPHNGHSNSFSALLELLDPQRFTRGVEVSPTQRDKVMVRRLKADLRDLGVDHFPRRHVVRWELRHDGERWSALEQDPLADEPSEPVVLGTAEAFELRLAELLDRYSKASGATSKARRVVLIRLQQRLLSSVDAFHRTLRHHTAALAKAETRARSIAQAEPDQAALALDDDPHGTDEDALESAEDADVARLSRGWHVLSPEARSLLDEMLDLATRYRDAPDAKARALLAWIRAHQCRAVRFGGADRDAPPADRRWTNRRLIVFTEFGHTLDHLRRLFAAAFAGTDRGDERLMVFRGGMGDAERDAVQRAFNGDPRQYPVRMLLATDAAREGVNLQGHCADLIHWDIPWNPARLEQRNGRIDRTLQAADDVYCRYFVYPQRPEDRILDTLVGKVDRIRREVGSLGTVLLDRLGSVLADGLDDDTATRLDAAEAAEGRADVVREELETSRQRRALEREIGKAGRILDRSRNVAGFRSALLHRALDEALDLVGAESLQTTDEPGVFRLPDLPESWRATVDTLRRPRERGEPEWEWRQDPPLPVVFEPPDHLADDRVHLHLEHPLVQRLLGRFRAQGTSADDLSRVTVLRDPESSTPHAVLFGRLSLFGPGASRLHDELVPVTAPWLPASETEHLQPLEAKAEQRLVDRLWRLLEDPTGDPPSETTRRQLLAAVPEVVQVLWPLVVEEADGLAHRAQDRLAARGLEERDALKALLAEQRRALEREVNRQLAFDFSEGEREQRRQWENDRRHMEDRLERLEREIVDEPPQLEALYRIAVRRLEPVALAFLWPTTR